jgi:hypothetical protein
MKESYRKGPASHPGPESCVVRRKAAGEALTGVRVGPVLSCEIKPFRAPTSLPGGGRQHWGRRDSRVTSRGRT